MHMSMCASASEFHQFATDKTSPLLQLELVDYSSPFSACSACSGYIAMQVYIFIVTKVFLNVFR